MDQRVIAVARARRRPAVAGARAAAAVISLIGVAGVAAWALTIRMPGTSYSGAFAPLSDEERILGMELSRDVEELAGSIGDRSMPHPAGLSGAADFIDRSLSRAGYSVERQRYEVDGRPAENLEATFPGTSRAGEIVVVGAHYDSVSGTTGADDDASGVATVLALARTFAGKGMQTARTVRFVAFANEEPPYFQTPAMGSVVYARRCRERGDRIVAMLSLESIGYYSDRPESQHYPFPFGLFYPTTGDFVGFVGNTSSRGLVRDALAAFRAHARFPSEGVAAPPVVPGVGWSDHWSFWEQGYPAVMVTDTAPFRNPDYHTTRDAPDRLSYGPFARVVGGLVHVVEELAGPSAP
jgi:hypothetical protein